MAERASLGVDRVQVVDVNGHHVGCPAYNQPTFTLCTCGATETAGLAWGVCPKCGGRHDRPIPGCDYV